MTLKSWHAKAAIIAFLVISATRAEQNLHENDYLGQCHSANPLKLTCSKVEEPAVKRKVNNVTFIESDCDHAPHKNICGDKTMLAYGVQNMKQQKELIKTLPKTYDLRKGNCVKICPSILEISNQGVCRSCWAVAATDVMTNRLCMQTNGTDKTRFSPSELLCHIRRDEGGCKHQIHNGVDFFANDTKVCTQPGSQRDAWAHWVKCGLRTPDCKKYPIQPCDHNRKTPKRISLLKCFSETNLKGKMLGCNKTKCDDGTNMTERIKGRACYWTQRKVGKIANNDHIKLEIYLHGPVEMTMRFNYTKFAEFNNQNNRIYCENCKENEKIGDELHSVRVVGWGEKGDKKYWIVANSFGSHWANQKGFFYLDFEHGSSGSGGKEVYAGVISQKGKEYTPPECKGQSG